MKAEQAAAWHTAHGTFQRLSAARLRRVLTEAEIAEKRAAYETLCILEPANNPKRLPSIPSVHYLTNATREAE